MRCAGSKNERNTTPAELSRKRNQPNSLRYSKPALKQIATANPFMKIHLPFEIGPRLAPALSISDSNGTAWLSYVDGDFIIDLPDSSEHKVEGYRAGWGCTLQGQFASILAFLGACAESRSHAERQGKPAMDGENSDLFPENVGAWAQQMSDEISMLEYEIEESDKDLLE